MECKIVSVKEHYDMLIDENCDPVRDNPILQMYMEKWDGVRFYDALELDSGKNVLEVGVGTGRIASKVLTLGCKEFTGLDISPKTIWRAKQNLSRFQNAEILECDIENFKRRDYYDVAFSVLTFMLIENKQLALQNIVDSLKPNGIIVLSIPESPEWFDYGSRKHKNYISPIEDYMEWLESYGCEVNDPIDLIDYFMLPDGTIHNTFGKRVATLIKATKK